MRFPWVGSLLELDDGVTPEVLLKRARIEKEAHKKQSLFPTDPGENRKRQSHSRLCLSEVPYGAHGHGSPVESHVSNLFLLKVLPVPSILRSRIPL
jgi:hypothetical protein